MSEKNISFEAIKSYKKDFEYSYTLGAFPTVELIKNKPEKIRNIYLHSHYKGDCDIEKLCRERHIPVVHDDKVFNRISQKENCFVAGVVKKYSCELMGDKNHVAKISSGKKGYTIALRTGPGMGECERIIASIEHFYGHMKIECCDSLGLCSVEYKEDLDCRKEEIIEFCNQIE